AYNVGTTSVNGGGANASFQSVTGTPGVAQTGTLNFTGGVISGNRQLNVSGGGHWSAGTFAGSGGRTKILNGANFGIDGSNVTHKDRKRVVQEKTGDMSWTRIISNINIGGGSPSGGTLLNSGTGLFEMKNNNNDKHAGN